MKSEETVIPTQSFLLPGQEYCVGLPWERAQLPKHGLPPAPPPPPPKGNALDESSLAADPFAGVEIGRCEVIRRLSLGSSKSLLALRTDADGTNALVVLKQLDIPDEAFADLQSHAQWMNYLQHTHLARVFPSERSDEGIFWVSEFASGATLAEISVACRKIGKGIPAGLSLAIVHETALALGALHSPPGSPHGFVHPESVCVTFDGTAKLLELGMFRVIGGRLLRPAALTDIAPYLAPEQVQRGQLADPRTDVFSLAAALYEALSGQKLSSSFETRATFVAPSSLNHALTKELDAVVLKALDADRTKRYANATEFAKALKSAASAYMWKLQQRADFVGDLFRNRRRREKVLLSSVEELITRKRSSQAAIPKQPTPEDMAAAQPPPPPADALLTPPAPVAAVAAPKVKVAPKRKLPAFVRPLALGLAAAALLVLYFANPPIATMAAAALAPAAPPEPIVVAAPPKPVEAVKPVEEAAEPATPPEPPTGLLASADGPKHVVKARKAHHKDDAPLPPWLQPKHHGH